MKLSPTFFFFLKKLHRGLQEKIYPEECRYIGERGLEEQEGEAGRVSHGSLCLHQRVPANDTGRWSSLGFLPETPSHLPRDEGATQHPLSQPGVREAWQPLGYTLPCSKNCRLLWVPPPSSFSLSFKAKETAQRSLTHVIWKYCDSQEIGLVSRETTVAVSFLLFLKSNFDSSSPVRKKFTKYTSEWACVDSRVYLLSDARDISAVPRPLPACIWLSSPGALLALLNLWVKALRER